MLSHSSPVLLFFWRFFLSEQFSLSSILDNLISASVISLVTLSFFAFVPRDFPDLTIYRSNRPVEIKRISYAGTRRNLVVVAPRAIWPVDQTSCGALTGKGADSRLRWVILDPRNEEACRKYVDIRNHHRLVFKSEWDLFRIHVEQYSTIFAAYQYHNNKSPICVELYLSNFFRNLSRRLVRKSGVYYNHRSKRSALYADAGKCMVFNLQE